MPEISMALPERRSPTNNTSTTPIVPPSLIFSADRQYYNLLVLLDAGAPLAMSESARNIYPLGVYVVDNIAYSIIPHPLSWSNTQDNWVEWVGGDVKSIGVPAADWLSISRRCGMADAILRVRVRVCVLAGVG